MLGLRMLRTGPAPYEVGAGPALYTTKEFRINLSK